MNKEFEENDELVKQYEERFLRTIKFINKNFPWGFKKTENSKTTPRNRFEAIAIGSYAALIEDDNVFDKDLNVECWIDGEGFRQVATSGAANVRSKILARIEFVKNKLLGK